ALDSQMAAGRPTPSEAEAGSEAGSMASSFWMNRRSRFQTYEALMQVVQQMILAEEGDREPQAATVPVQLNPRRLPCTCGDGWCLARIDEKL
ncbi:unnamed protein product, partial [Symbiodinium pilosum]